MGHIPGPGVADRDSSICTLSLLYQNHRHRLAHDIAPPHHNHMLALNLNAASQKQLLDAVRRAGKKSRLPNHQPSHIYRMEPIHILSGVNGSEHPLFIYLLGQRKLYKYAVDLRVLIKLLN